MPRVRQSTERLAPAELMVMLHEQEKEIGLKSAIAGAWFCKDHRRKRALKSAAAIGICFAMPDVFRSETLGVVMQQIMDEPTLPKLFMRTVGSSAGTTSRIKFYRLLCRSSKP